MNNIDKYIHIALTMNSFESGKSFSINELAKRAKVHYMTAKKAIHFFSWCQKNINFSIHPDLSYALKHKKRHERIKMIKKKKGE